jgi:FKBP-type peptidyl-prolyl cis-trans isomerase FkpA
MKKIVGRVSAIMLAFVIASCDASGPKQTASGITYEFLTKGNGQTVEKGSYVKAKLSLMLGDSVIWDSYDRPDSLYIILMGYDPAMNEGFREMAYLMREGDNARVTIPSSLAYGEKGRGIIPPNADLVYDRFEMVSVSKPRKLLIDTLNSAYTVGGSAQVARSFEGLVKSGEIDDYHLIVERIEPMLSQYLQNMLFAAVEEMVVSFNQVTWEGKQHRLAYYHMSALQGQNKFAEAIAIGNVLIEDGIAEPELMRFMNQLKHQLKQWEGG